MRVTFNTFPDTLLGRLQSLGGEQNKALTQLSTGQRISAPSDDAPAMQRILNLRTEKKQNQQYYRNATDGLEKSQVTFSTLEQFKNIIVRASELAAGVSGATSGQEFIAKQAELDQLVEQGLNLANTKLRGSYIFSGNTPEVKPFEKSASDGFVYKGGTSSVDMHVSESSTISANSSFDDNISIRDSLKMLKSLKGAMSSKSYDMVSTIRIAPEPKSISSMTNGVFIVGSSSPFSVGDAVKLSNLPARSVLSEEETYYVDKIVGNGFTIINSKGEDLALWNYDSPNASVTTNTQITSTKDSSAVEDRLLSALSRAGTIQYRLETVQKDLELRFESSEKLISTDADVDFAEATVRLNRSQMAYQAAIQSGAKIQNNSLLDYLR